MTVAQLRQLLAAYPDTMEVQMFTFGASQPGWWDIHPIQEVTGDHEQSNVLLLVAED